MSTFAIDEPTDAPLASALETRVATGILLAAAALAALFLLPSVAFAWVVLAIVAVGADEWARLARFDRRGRIGFVTATLMAGAALVLAGIARGWSGIVVPVCGAATLFWIAVGVPSVLARRQPRSAPARALAGFVVLLGALVALAALQARAPALALAVMAIVWVADTSAYLVGRRFGRRKLAPRISPGKTWEGAAGGIGAVVLYALAVALSTHTQIANDLRAPGIFVLVVIAVALAALSIVGDLYESLLKRTAGVKDSGALLPGHGGVLDRIDALLAAMPPAALAVHALATR